MIGLFVKTQLLFFVHLYHKQLKKSATVFFLPIHQQGHVFIGDNGQRCRLAGKAKALLTIPYMTLDGTPVF
jgi:hypothetical protein